ncbi:MGDG synthase family glycosyltransferase [Streptomyces sp. NBC_01497]|uniref:MGDG synthase family glycosyltransferase n=1 Tax=Streptomyces sp. NBC_01497 TaxID=2903885 RepID=UPI002E372840|nr:UDP-N-acetylglucosamine--N-acetylglucosamine transferase [Streptomyces sp. NBC_01497]
MPAIRASRRITVISASVGAGHDGAAAELTRRLEAAGFAVDRYDFVDLLPYGLGRLLSGAYHRLLVLAPSLYQWIYAAMGRTGRPGLVLRLLLRRAERRTALTVTPATSAVVATYPAAGQVLGALRERGALEVPAITYLTDFSVHPLWVAPGVDVHLAAHDVPAGEARALGARGVHVAGPVAGPAFGPVDESERRAIRERFALPSDSVLALLVAGSWGVGQVRRAASEIRDGGTAVPVVVCGTNAALLRRLRAEGFAHVRGWEPDMGALMRACDVLVQNAGGMTSLEAFATGLPVLSYRCIPGHGRTNAAALEAAGLAPWVRDDDELDTAIVELTTGARGERQRATGLALFPPGAGPAGAIATAAGGAEAPRVPRPARVPAVAPSGHAATVTRTARVTRAAAQVRRPRPTFVAATGLALTLALGIGAPLANAAGASVPVRLTTAAHRFLEDHAW